MKRRFTFVFLLCISSGAFCQTASMIDVGDGVQLYCLEKGHGPALIFIPGWTMTTQFFSNQVEALSSDFRVVTFDPRSHGKSTKTTEGNTYYQHGKDLKKLIEKLRITEAVLVGWSSGAHTIFSYLRTYGTEHIASVVILDETPKWIGDVKKEWVYGSYDDYNSTVRGILETREKDAEGIAKWMAKRSLSEDEVRWMVNEMMQTPTHAAFMLYIDSMFSDYTPEVKTVSEKIPMVFMLREGWLAQATEWLRHNAPKAHVVQIESHLAFWEKPDDFNLRLRKVLLNIK